MPMVEIGRAIWFQAGLPLAEVDFESAWNFSATRGELLFWAGRE